MKTILALVCLGVGTLECSAQSPTPGSRSEEDRTGIFKLGTVIGKTPDEITATTVFGKPNFVRTGHYGLPTCIDYWISMPSQNPYSHEIGFFADGKTGYIIYTKRTLEPTREINDAEVTGLLRKAARGGEWKKDETKGQYKGTAYLYTHEVDKQKFELLAYRNASKKALIVYHPNVTPSLDGPGGLGGLAYAFADGQRIVWAEGDGNDMVTAYVDAKSPWPNLAAFAASDPSGANLEAVSAEVRKFAAENKVTLFSKPAFDNFKTVAKYLAIAGKKPLPANAVNELKNITVWGAPLNLQDKSAAQNWLLGAKYELLRQNPVAREVDTSFAQPTPDLSVTPK